MTNSTQSINLSRAQSLAEVLQLTLKNRRDFRFFLVGFLDDFYTDSTREGRRRRIEEDPGLSHDQKLDALIGAIGEHLCHRWQLGNPPPWTNQSERLLSRFWCMGEEHDKAEFLQDSPSAYRRRMIFTEAEPLRRARMPRDGRWWAYEQLRGGLSPTQEEIEEFSKKPSPY